VSAVYKSIFILGLLLRDSIVGLTIILQMGTDSICSHVKCHFPFARWLIRFLMPF